MKSEREETFFALFKEGQIANYARLGGTSRRDLVWQTAARAATVLPPGAETSAARPLAVI
jgi:hypothetical protein